MHVNRGAYPTQCAKCGLLCASDDALDRHLIEARHTEDPDWPVHAAGVRLEAAKARLDAAIRDVTAAKHALRVARQENQARIDAEEADRGK